LYAPNKNSVRINVWNEAFNHARSQNDSNLRFDTLFTQLFIYLFILIVTIFKFKKSKKKSVWINKTCSLFVLSESSLFVA
jgi:hypothetical protein